MDREFAYNFVVGFLLGTLIVLLLTITFYVCSLRPTFETDEFHPRDLPSTAIQAESDKNYEVTEIRPVVLTKEVLAPSEPASSSVPETVIMETRAKRVHYKAPKAAHILEQQDNSHRGIYAK